MPIAMWKHNCKNAGSLIRMGSSVCQTCGASGEFDGWHLSMHEAMARYQSRYGLKPIGPHRTMADNLFSAVTVTCNTCGGRGLRDLDWGASCEICGVCRGLGCLFSASVTDLIEIRLRVLEAFPDAAAASVPDFATQPSIHDLAQGTILDLGSP
jgi:hypothetical protein